MVQATLTRDFKKEIKDELAVINEIGTDAEECIYLLQVAYMHNSKQHISDARAKAEKIMNRTHALTNRITELGNYDPSFKDYESVPVHFFRISEEIGKFAALIDRKISDGILFSDKCCNETIFLIQRLIDMMRQTADMVFVRNKIIANYVQETEKGLMRRSLEYATLHEERLIEGICSSAESKLYLDMLEVMKSIAWQAKEIVTKLVK